MSRCRARAPTPRHRGIRAVVVAAALVTLLVATRPALHVRAEGVGEGEATLIPLAYHPYPDESDPFGVPYFRTANTSWDYFQGYYAIYDKDRKGFDFPSVVVDGTKFIEGAPGGATDTALAAYRSAFAARRDVEAPVTLVVNASVAADATRLAFTVVPHAPLAEHGLVLKWAIVEDDVTYRPPPALSNGVFVHRFTVRALFPWPPAPLDLSKGTPVTLAANATIAPTWAREHLSVAAWVQNEDETSPRFRFPEVLQAARHPFTQSNATVQVGKAVLLEEFTATWCSACLFGDGAINTLAAENGLASTAYAASPWTYLREPEVANLVGGSAAGLVLAVVVLAPARLGVRRR